MMEREFSLGEKYIGPLFRTFRPDMAFMGILMAAVIFLFHDLLAGFWRADDPAILFHALNSAGLSAFYDPENWHRLSTANLTPWITFSFKTDLRLAGLNAKVFYGHQLFSLLLCTLAVYALARQWLKPHDAVGIPVLFLAGVPVMSVAGLLMTRHYIEGLFFSILSLLFLIHAEKRNSLGMSLASAFFYALACTAKEVFVPLPLVLLCLPRQVSPGQRLHYLFPVAIVASVYPVWRGYMLESLFGGYGASSAHSAFQIAERFADGICHLPAFLFGDQWKLPVFVFLFTLSISLAKNTKRILSASAVLVAVLLPVFSVLTVGIHYNERFVFVLWLAFSLAAIMAIRHSVVLLKPSALQYPAGILLFLAIFIPAAIQQTVISASHRMAYRQFDATGRFVMETHGGETGFIPDMPPVLGYLYYVNYLCDIKRQAGLSCPQTLIKGVPLEIPLKRLFQYDPKSATMQDITDRMTQEIERASVKDTQSPLSARLRFEGKILKWEFGPHEVGSYYLTSSLLGKLQLQKSGALRVPDDFLSHELRVLYESPEGWSTISPLFRLDKDHAVDWKRPPLLPEPENRRKPHES